MCFSQGYEFLQTQCKEQGSFYIVQNQPTFFTCSGLDDHHKIFWAVTYPNGSEIRIGECSNCTVCGTACRTFTTDYVVARTRIYSTLYFKHNRGANDGAVVKCSSVDYSIEKTCNINVIKPCRNNHLVLLHRYAPIQCQGLQSSQAMHWETVYSDGTTRSIANCERCRPGHNCPACSVNDNYFTVIRTPTYSTLKIVGNDELYNQTTLRCSSTDETLSVACNVSLSYYRISQCTNGVLEISEGQTRRPIYCEGLHDTDRMFWKKTDLAVPPVHVAMCSDETESYSCNIFNSKVSVSRNATFSQLVIRNYTREDWEKKTLICTKNDGAVLDTCRIRITYPVLLRNSTVSVHDDFTVTAQVEIEKMYDSDFDVTCVWHLVKETKITRSQKFTERDDGSEFYHGSCSVTMDAPSEEGHYLVHVEVMPEPGLKDVGDFNI
ncbi:uncharacterized protein, partial [Littorina saxatilis]|uniref:uncharacterized protein n=1 Tax=Littorina saxatilis TaxID=31220 RepID=UPI0038B58EA7